MEGLVDAPGPPVCVVSIVRSGDILQVQALDIVVYLMTTHSEVAKCYNGKIFMPKTLSK